jgi:hypothetical protein
LLVSLHCNSLGDACDLTEPRYRKRGPKRNAELRASSKGDEAQVAIRWE